MACYKHSEAEGFGFDTYDFCLVCSAYLLQNLNQRRLIGSCLFYVIKFPEIYLNCMSAWKDRHKSGVQLYRSPTTDSCSSAHHLQLSPTKTNKYRTKTYVRARLFIYTTNQKGGEAEPNITWNMNSVKKTPPTETSGSRLEDAKKPKGWYLEPVKPH